MVQGEVRYTKVSTDVHEEAEPDPNEESDEEGQVTVYFKLPGDRPQEKTLIRLTCFRMSAALVLLGIVLVFALLQWYKWWPDTEEFPDVGTNITNISQERDEHHHHTMDEDDEQEDAEDPHHHEHTALYHHAVVLTASANCSSIGKALLQEGGNVVDAAIASLLCLGVVHPHTAGVGGMFSAVLYNNTSGSLQTIRSTAPQMSLPTFGVPSILQGIQELHSRWGRSDWSRLFEEAITLAQEGFLIDDVLGRALESYKEEILVSELCDLFCDASGRVKSVGAIVKNQNLSELLQRASLNESNFLETLAVKLSEDLSVSERPAFLAAVQHSRGEINEFLIIEGEKYSVLSAGLPFSVQMLSDILQQVRQQNLSFQNSADFNRTSAAYSVLLSLIREPDDSSLAEKYRGVIDALSLNTQSSHIAVLDKSGNFIVMSASLNSTWGSGRFLPSTGILLNGFSANVSNLPYFNIPLVLRLTEDHVSPSNETEDNEEENEIEIVVMTGGLSALFNAAVLLHNRIDLGLSSKEAISSPLLHLQPPAFCLSSTLNDSDVYMLSSDVGGELQQVDECTDKSPSMLLRLHAEHVSAYGAPAANAHINGY